MNVVIMAADETQIQSLVDDITRFLANMNIETFLDPLMALKYLYSHKTDLVFVKDKIKTIPAGRFVNLVRRNCKDIDITVVSDDDKLENLALQAGADRLVTASLTREVLESIVHSVENFADD